MLLGLVVEAGLRGGLSYVRPRLSYSPFAFVVSFSCPLVAIVGGVCAGIGFDTGASSLTGESGGGGMFVPSVRLKFMGVRAGSSNRSFGLPLIGILCPG